MGILKPNERVDYEKIREQNERVDYEKIREQVAEQEEIERIRSFLWGNTPISTEETWTSWYSSDAGVYTDEYNPDGSKK